MEAPTMGDSTELKEVVTMGVDQNPAATVALMNVMQIRDKIRALGPRPDALAVQNARRALVASDAALAQSLESIVFAAPPADADIIKWRASQNEKEKAIREAAEREKLPSIALLQLEELHQLYDNMLKEAELLLERGDEVVVPAEEEDVEPFAGIGRTLDEALEKQCGELDLSRRKLEYVPESIGKISSLTVLNLASNHIEVLPDAIAGLVNLLRLDVSSNQLKILPDSVGLLKNLKYLNASSNQLRALPESMSGCSALVELNADFNKLEYLPSNFGRGLDSLEKLSLHLNNLTYLPESLCEVKTLKHLDVHFNKIRSLPKAIGNLNNLQVLDASSNFNDLVWLPDSMGDLVSLTYLDLSYNQIKELPLSFGRLRSITTLKLDENPLIDPPLEVLQQGTEATMKYLADRWEASLLAEEEKAQQDASSNAVPWLPAAAQGTWMGGWISGVYSNISSYVAGSMGQRGKDDYLEQQL